MRISFPLAKTASGLTSISPYHIIQLSTAGAHSRSAIKIACFSYLTPVTSSICKYSPPSSCATIPMPQTRSQAKNYPRLLHSHNNSPITTQLKGSVSAVPYHVNSSSQSPDDSQDIPLKPPVATEERSEASTAVSKHSNTSRSARKRKRHHLETQTAAAFQKPQNTQVPKECNDIEDAPNSPSPDSARQILHLLQSFYRRPLSTATHPKTRPRKALLDSLVATILSQATTNTNSSRAFKELKSRFATWEAALEAGPKEIEACIACGGLAQAKSKVIHDILTRLKNEHNVCSLDFIRDMPTDQVKKVLCSFKGVGPKTASCVLMFAMDRAEFPVDTHVRRITGRLGWMPPSSTPEKTYERLNSCLPDDTKYDLHVLLVEHGRKTCKASSPLCDKCPLLQVCPSAEKKSNMLNDESLA